MLKYRLILGPIMIAALLAVFWLDNQLEQISVEGTWLQALMLGRAYLPGGLLILGLFLVLVVLGTRELNEIFHHKRIFTSRLMLLAAGVLGCLPIYLTPAGRSSQTALAVYATVLVAVFLASLVRYAWRGRIEGAVAVASATLLAMTYMGTLPGFYLAIRLEHSAWVVLGVILVTKACDIGAYFTGKAIGRHKLISWLSPGKTWEGLVGGLALSAAAAAGLAAVANQFELAGRWVAGQEGQVFEPAIYPPLYTGLAGMLIGLVGQFGDLTASLFKRDAGIKDSGRSIPGFGGVLDVVDSPIVVAPVAYWLLQVMSRLGGSG